MPFKKKNTIALLGGTFDPVHLGHLQIARKLLETVPFTEIRFIPNKQPLLKNTAQASTAQRLAMLKSALADEPKMIIDERELKRETPSYMVETLQSLREEFSTTPLALIIGMDAFLQLPQWHQWQDLIKLAHIIVINRKDCLLPSDEPLISFIKQHQIEDIQQLQQSPAGKLLFIELPLIDISSTAIRSTIANGGDVDALLPRSVYDYIKAENLYPYAGT